MKVTAVIKASCKSDNFPKRYNINIGSMNLLEFIVKRIQRSSFVSKIAIAISDEKIDDYLFDICQDLELPVFRGAYGDSIGRVYGAAEMTCPDIVVKVSGDSPLVDPWEMDKLIKGITANKAIYGYNEHYNGIILGMGVEVFTFSLIEKVNSAIYSPAQRNFGTRIFREILQKDEMYICNINNPRPEYRVSLAVPNDRIIIEQIISESKETTHNGIVEYLDRNPAVVSYAAHNISKPTEVGLEKLFLFPGKVHSFCEKENNIDFSYPITIELSLTNKCNLSCVWCSDNSLRKRAMIDIDFDLLLRLLDDLALHNTKGLVIEGGGEPTLYPHFRETLLYAKEKGLRVGLITNGVNVPYLDLVDEFDWIRFSLDAANQKQYLEGKGRDCFNQVVANIREVAQRRNRDCVTIGVAYVLTANNENGLEDLILNLRRINVDYMQIRPVIDHPEIMPRNLNLSYLNKYSTRTFAVTIHNMVENVVSGNLGLPCRAHSLSTVIAASGDVYLCGRLNKYDWIEPLGNLADSSFHDIWHGRERIRQSNMVADGDFCRERCPECRLTKYNRLIQGVKMIKTRNFI